MDKATKTKFQQAFIAALEEAKAEKEEETKKDEADQK